MLSLFSCESDADAWKDYMDQLAILQMHVLFKIYTTRVYVRITHLDQQIDFFLKNT